jgi:hypothetical protein
MHGLETELEESKEFNEWQEITGRCGNEVPNDRAQSA